MARPRLTGGLSSGIQRPMPPHISIMGNRFTLIDASGQTKQVETFDPKLGPYLDCCIVDVNAVVSRIYYESEGFDPDNPTAPDCYSDNGTAPSANAPSPQSARCDGCPQAAWGATTSKLTGKGVPKCRSYKKMAVILPDLPSMVFLLAVPPASLKAAQAYSQKVDDYKVDLPDIITRVSFAPGVLGTLVFDAVEHADDEMKARVDKLWENDVGCPQIVGRNDKPALAAPVTTMRLEPAQPQPQPAQQDPLAAFDATATAGRPAFGQTNGEKKPPGRPRKTKPQMVQEPPKAALGKPLQAPATEQGKFGVVENPAAADDAMGKTLDSLFGTKFE